MRVSGTTMRLSQPRVSALAQRWVALLPEAGGPIHRCGRRNTKAADLSLLHNCGAASGRGGVRVHLVEQVE